jgi:hypothetical protein
MVLVKTKAFGLVGCLLISGGFFFSGPQTLAEEKAGWWSAGIKQSLSRSGPNRSQLVKALENIAPDQRQGMAFLITNMPLEDLKSLSADFLLENVRFAYQARKQVPWGRQVPKEIFLGNVLPYANVDEARDPWRKKLFKLCLPLVKDCKTPAEAAQALNATIFKKLNVRYSTQRKKPHQSPRESIEQGLASCTGLSILLCDACRSVGVPARLVGTPLWANKSGNHTWVEIWDRDWHFTGAAEPDPKGLDRAWFSGQAGQAIEDSPQHAIYAASFRKTGLTFPLVWAPQRKDVYAENVTARYARISREKLQDVARSAKAFFTASAREQAQWKFAAHLARWLAGHEHPVRQAVWKAYRDAPIHAALKKDFEKHVVQHGKHRSPYTVKKVGTRPLGGWPLFIALHGGGNAPKQVNDSQWKIMQIYYRDQNAVTGYQYLALRAPNDTWNGFYDDYVPPLIGNLIRQFLLFGDVDSDKVFLLGYSHGGYGAFFIGPKIPDRFAAVHSSAAAPTDGAISPKTLRNTRFTYMVGEHDNAYGRRQRCEDFNKAIQKLKAQNQGDYPVEMEFKKGFGHVNLPDRDKIKEMYPFTRNPVPRRLSWALTDRVVTHFFWLSVPKPDKGQEIEAAIRDNTVRITTRNVKKFDLHLDSRLLAFDKPLRITVDGKSQVRKIEPSLLILCRSLQERGDPAVAFICRVPLETGAK